MKQTTNFNEYNIVGDDSSLTINNSSGSLVSFTNGNVGIGTTTPTETLDVNGTFNVSGNSYITSLFPTLYFTDTNGSPDYYISAGNGYFRVFDYTNGTTRLRINNLGNVGIGTTSPAEKLHIDGNVRTDGILKLYDITDTQTIELNPDGDSYINGKLAVGKTTNIFYPFEVQDNNTNISTAKQTLARFYRNDGTYNPELHIRASTDGIDIFQTYTTLARNLTISNPSGEVLRINSNGNIGIGTTNSGTKLHISGDPALNAIGTQSLLRLERPFDAGVSFAQGADIAIGRGNTYPSTQMRFILDNGTNNPTNPQTTIMTLDSSGNVGIGTDNPTETLHINGTFRSKSIWTTQSGVTIWGNESTQYGGLTWGVGYATVLAYGGNVLHLASNGATPDMTIATTGDIGIGTTTPTEKLDINGNVKADGILKLYDITDTQKISLNPDGNSYINGGNVGIGTTTPNSKLDVYGAISLSGKISLRHNINGQSWYIGELAGQNSNSYRSNAFGYNTSKNNTGDAYSDAFGSYALENNTAGYSNGFGAFALQNNTGVYSNAFGFQALQNNTGASSNGFGGSSLGNNSGRQTNGFGRLTLRNNSGILNTALGDEAGYETSTLAGSYNTFLGANASYGTATTISNSTAVGANVTLTDSNTVILGNGANVGIGTTTPTDKLDVNGNIKSSGYINGKRCGAAGYLAAPVNITVTTANTYYPIGVFTVPVAADFIVGTTYPNGLKYTGTIAQTFHITWNATIESTSNNVSSIIDIEKNGVSIPMAKMGTYSKTGGEIYNLNGQCVVDLDVNDEIRFVVTANNNGEILTFDYFTASIKEFFD